MARVILIVDDEERILFVLRHALKDLHPDLRVETATSAERALEKVRENSFDLVISDLIMPDMAGIEFTEKVLELRSDVKVVWMTAYGCGSFAGEAKRLGVHSCVEKPLEIDGFRQVVRDAIGDV